MEHHEHTFEVDRIVQEPVSALGTNTQDVAYIICRECGLVKKEVVAGSEPLTGKIPL